jgi:hypothetical protein
MSKSLSLIVIPHTPLALTIWRWDWHRRVQGDTEVLDAKLFHHARRTSGARRG